MCSYPLPCSVFTWLLVSSVPIRTRPTSSCGKLQICGFSYYYAFSHQCSSRLVEEAITHGFLHYSHSTLLGGLEKTLISAALRSASSNIDHDHTASLEHRRRNKLAINKPVRW
uniref:Putative secreted protein n=1 Tax=Anopheles darlingi TaxID=43151 RepID=A0A2M4DIN7_ANODA